MQSTAGELSPASVIELPHKPGAQIAYRFIPSNEARAQQNKPEELIVFINGLMLPMSSWAASIKILTQSATPAFYSILTYDRYGQGETKSRDPMDDPFDPGHGHDILSSVTDLYHLLSVLTAIHFPAESPTLVFVAHSIGVPLARLYCAAYPGTVSALLFLDSNMANSDQLSIFPDPTSPSFEPTSLPPGTTVDDLIALRDRISHTFHPSVGSQEGLSRRNLPSLLPYSDSPKLIGENNRGLFITVVNHGLDAFAEEGLRMTGTPKALNKVFMNPAWWRYNEGLCELTDADRSRGPVEAVGSGHFVQRDRPDLVAAEVINLLKKLGLVGNGKGS